MSEDSKCLTRREFIRAGVAGIAATAAMPVLAACAPAAAPAPTKPVAAPTTAPAKPAAPKEATLSIIGLSGHPSWLATKELMKKFEADSAKITGGTTIKFNVSEFDLPQINDKVNLDFQAKRGEYDIVWMNSAQTFGYWTENKMVAPLTPFLTPKYDVDDFMKLARGIGSTKDGTIYGIAIMIEDRMLSYRKDLFQEAGIQVPKTVDEMMAAAKKLNKPEKNQYGFTQRNRAGGSAGFDLLGWLYAYGARVFDDKYVATLDKPEAKQALEAYLEMNKLSAPGSAKSYGEVTKELQTGVAAMGNDVTIITPLLEDPKQSQFAGKFGYAVAPAGPKAPRPMTSSHLLAICALSKQQELAWKFIEWLTAKEQGKDWCFAGGAAFRKSHYENKEIVDKFPMYPLFKEILDRGEPDYVPRIRPSLEIMAKLADEVNAAVVGTKNAEQALKDGNQAINDILKRGGYQK